MKKIILCVCVTSIMSMTGCSPIDSLKPFDEKQAALLFDEHYTPKPAQQMIKLSLPQKRAWKKIDLSESKKGSPVMLVPANQSAANWQESFSTRISAYIGDPDMTASKFSAETINHAAMECKQIGSKILSSSPEAILYRLDLVDCNKGKDRTEISKAFNGRDAVYVVRYIAINGEVSADEINKMSRVVETARLLPNPAYHR